MLRDKEKRFLSLPFSPRVTYRRQLQLATKEGGWGFNFSKVSFFNTYSWMARWWDAMDWEGRKVWGMSGGGMERWGYIYIYLAWRRTGDERRHNCSGF